MRFIIASCDTSRCDVSDVDFEGTSHQHVDVLRGFGADEFEICSVVVSASDRHDISSAMAALMPRADNYARLALKKSTSIRHPSPAIWYPTDDQEPRLRQKETRRET